MSSSIRIAQKIHNLVAVENALLPNSYDVSFTVLMHTSKPYEQNIVVERLRFFCESMMSGSILIGHANPIRETLAATLENNLIVLDAEPYDAPVCNIFYLKASSILEEHATIESMSMCSYLGQEIDYFADSDDDYSSHSHASWLPKNQQPWWLNSDHLTNDDATEVATSWADLGLGWKELRDDAETTIIEFPKFTPKIIQGELSGS